jgi:hypothetical protein
MTIVLLHTTVQYMLGGRGSLCLGPNQWPQGRAQLHTTQETIMPTPVMQLRTARFDCTGDRRTAY